jgi:hypothetical protein
MRASVAPRLLRRFRRVAAAQEVIDKDHEKPF